MAPIKALAAYDEKKEVEAYEYEPRELHAFDVEIKVTHCGVCASDVHLVDKDWGAVQDRPIVPGHEIVGTVVRAGPDAVLKVGERVGAGLISGACGECADCKDGCDQYCPSQEHILQGKHKASGTRNYGGFADSVLIDSRFAYTIPDSLGSAEAAPLLCAGMTVYSPLKLHLGTSGGRRVGVVGIGGLGHLGVQIAKAMGHSVTAISHSPSKEEFARKLGADAFVNSNDAESMKAAAGSLDLLLVTISVPIDWGLYLSLVRARGKVALVGVQAKLELPGMGLIMRGITIGGTLVSSSSEAREMLALCGEHKIGAMVTELPMSQANDALERVRQGKPRFRDVLVNKTE